MPPPSAASTADAVFLSVTGQLGGAERLLLDLCTGLRAAFPERRLAAVVAAEGPLGDALRDVGVDVHDLPIPDRVAALGDSSGRAIGSVSRVLELVRAVWPVVRYAWSLGRLLRRLRPRVVHSNGFKMHVLGALARPRDAALVWHLHDYVTSRPVMSGALRRLAGRCAAAVAISESVRTDARRVLGERLPVVAVLNAVDAARFQSGPVADLDALAGMPRPRKDTVRIGLVATMAWWKGHQVFLDALAELPDELPWRGYVVGGPLYRTAGSETRIDALRAIATRLGIEDRVGFTGFVADTPAVMRALDVVVHASIAPEPFGLVIVEGMAAGRAVVASDGGAARELVRHGVDALLSPPGDAVTLAERLERLVADDALRTRLGAAARVAATTRFSLDRLARGVAAVHDRAVARVRPPADAQSRATPSMTGA